MAEIGCKNQNGFAGQPASAFSDGLRRRRKIGLAFAANNMAASRLKMILPAMLPKLQTLHTGVREVVVRVVPKPPAPAETNSLRLSEAALDSFDEAAAKLEGKHPELGGIGRIGAQAQPLKSCRMRLWLINVKIYFI